MHERQQYTRLLYLYCEPRLEGLSSPYSDGASLAFFGVWRSKTLGTRLLHYLSRRLQCGSRIINAVPSLLAVPFWIVEAQSINRAVSNSAVRLERGDKKRKETGERRGKKGLHSLL